MTHFRIEKLDCKQGVPESYILYNFYDGRGDIFIEYIKYNDGINDLRHLRPDLSEEFLIPIVEEMITESKFNEFGHSDRMFQLSEFQTRHKRRIRNDKLEELGI